MKRITFLNSGCKLNKKSAMTLVEVLITLLIIGVVAAFTIPIIISATQDAELKTAWKKAYSDLSQATSLIKNDNGGTLIGIADGNTLRDTYLNYFKYIVKCDSYSNTYGTCFHRLDSNYFDTIKLLNGTSHLQINSYYPYFSAAAAGAILNNGNYYYF